jgi:hypothetical protein
MDNLKNQQPGPFETLCYLAVERSWQKEVEPSVEAIIELEKEVSTAAEISHLQELNARVLQRVVGPEVIEKPKRRAPTLAERIAQMWSDATRQPASGMYRKPDGTKISRELNDEIDSSIENDSKADQGDVNESK